MKTLPLIDQMGDHIGKRRHLANRMPMWRQFTAEARRFLFDADAATALGTLMAHHTPAILANFEFARPPFPFTYIELPMPPLWSAWTGMPESVNEATGDKVVAYAMFGNTVVPIASDGKRPPEVMLYNFTFHDVQHRPLATVVPPGFTDAQLRTLKAVVLWGGRRHDNKPGQWHLPEVGNTKETVDHALNPQVDLTLDKEHFSKISRTDFIEWCFRSSGDGLISLAAILMLTRPHRTIVINEEPRRAGLYRGKRRVFHKHNAVTVHLFDPGRFIRKGDGTHASPRLHDVRGHWRHYNRTSGCDHQWEPTNHDRKRWHCTQCAAFRRWVEPFIRGDAEKGVVTKHYEVRP